MINVDEKVNGIALPTMMYKSGSIGGFDVPDNISMDGVAEYLDILKIQYRIRLQYRSFELLNADLYPCNESGFFTDGPWDHIELVKR